MKPIILIITLITVLGLINLAYAQPYLLKDQGIPKTWPCEEFKTIQKTFIAESTKINLGLMCATNSRIKVFDCTGESCDYKTEAYKNNNQLPSFSGFETGQKYSYQCFACEGSCALSVNEGEKIDLKKFFQGVDFKVKSAPTKLNQDGTWLTEDEDVGQYNILVDLKENKNDLWEEVKFCLEIKEFNQPAKLVIIDKDITIKEGQTLKLDVKCEDDNNATLTISGWMDSLEKKISYTDAGTHKVEVTCLDQQNQGEKEVINVKVLNTNRAPVIEWFAEIVG